MIDILQILQALFVIVWAVPIYLFRKQAWSKAGDVYDRLAAAMWFSSATTVAFPIRWLIQSGSVRAMPHDELAAWSALYVLGIFSAAYLTLSVHQISVAHARA